MKLIDMTFGEVAARQYGVASCEQGLDVGMTFKMQRRRVSTGRLERVHRRVLRVAGAPPSWRQQLMAATLEAGAGSAASHRSAAALHRLDTFKPGIVEITVPRARKMSLDGSAVVHRSRGLPAVDIVMMGPLPVTTVARTLLDVRHVVSEEQLLHAFDSALRDGLLSLPFLRWRFDDLDRFGRPWSAAIRRLAAEKQHERRPTTVLERKFLRIVDEAGLPRPLCQHEVRERGKVLAHVDFAWPERLVAVEVDGHGSHATRTQRRHDRKRAAELRVRGWQVQEFTYEQVDEEPEWVTSILVAILGLGR